MTDATKIEIHDTVLKDIINGKRNISFEFMAANILVKHVQHLYIKEPSDDTLNKCCTRLKKLLLHNAELPSVKKDLAKIGALEN